MGIQASYSSGLNGIMIDLSGPVDPDSLDADDFRFMFTYGSGIGRYIGLATGSDAVIDEQGELDAIDSFGGFFGHRHAWSKTLRSSIVYSSLEVDNDTSLTGDLVTESIQSIHLNLIYAPISNLTLGVEYIKGNRELENGADGDLDRIQFSTKYVL